MSLGTCCSSVQMHKIKENKLFIVNLSLNDFKVSNNPPLMVNGQVKYGQVQDLLISNRQLIPFICRPVLLLFLKCLILFAIGLSEEAFVYVAFPYY